MHNESANLDTLPICIDMPLPADRQHGSLAAALRERLWPGSPAVVRVGFLDGQPAWHATVRRHAVTWCQYAAVAFHFSDVQRFDPRQADIRISFAQPGNWSYIGTDARRFDPPAETMVLGSLRDTRLDYAHRRIVLHEFGHALGLVHEHRTPNYRWTDEQGVEQVGIPWDTEAVYRYYAQYGWNRVYTDEQVMKRYSHDQLIGTTFDPQSIMLYAIEPSLTGGRFAVGWNEELSAGDKAFIAALYPQPATGG